MKFELTIIDSSGRKQGTFRDVDRSTMILNVEGTLEDYPGWSIEVKQSK